MRNQGGSDLRLEEPRRGSPYDESFSFDLSATRVPPGQQANLTVTYRPGFEGDAVAQVVLSPTEALRNAFGGAAETIREQALTLRGTGVATTVKAEPRLLDFGQVVVDTTKSFRFV